MIENKLFILFKNVYKDLKKIKFVCQHSIKKKKINMRKINKIYNNKKKLNSIELLKTS